MPTTVAPAETSATTRRSRRDAPAGLVVLGFAALLLVANRWGEYLIDAGHTIDVRVPPLYARWDPSLGLPLLFVAVLGAALVVALPRLVAILSWRASLVAAFAASMAWTVSVNATRGRDAFVDGVANRHEYINDVASIDSIFDFWRGFTDNLDAYAIHTQGHPPGFVTILWVLDRVGLGGANWASALCVAAGATAIVAVLVAVRDLAGEDIARAALPFVALAPVVLWFASSADAVFAALAAIAVAGMVRGFVSGRLLPAVGGGAVLGIAMLCTYGALVVAVVPVVIVALLPRPRPLRQLVAAGAAAGAVLVSALLVGFNYYDGLSATRAAYFEGIASTRPYAYALVANLAALAVAIGPATVVGLTRVRFPLARLTTAALAAVVLANVSGMSKLEVERIWLPFAVLLLPATVAVGRSATMQRAFLVGNVAWVLLVQGAIETRW